MMAGSKAKNPIVLAQKGFLVWNPLLSHTSLILRGEKEFETLHDFKNYNIHSGSISIRNNFVIYSVSYL